MEERRAKLVPTVMVEKGRNGKNNEKMGGKQKRNVGIGRPLRKIESQAYRPLVRTKARKRGPVASIFPLLSL